LEESKVTKWDDALVAYDAELEVLEEIREQYASFLESTFAGAQRAVEERLSKEWSGKVYRDGPKTVWSAQPRSVLIAAWSARAFEGPAATLVCGVELDVRAGFSKEQGALRRKLFLAAAESELGGVLPGSVPNRTLHGEYEDACVRVLSTRIESNVIDALAGEIASLADLAGALDRWVACTDWATKVLDRVLRKPPVPNAEGVRWLSDKRQRQAGGFYVQADSAIGEHSVKVSVRPPGDVVLGHWGGPPLDEALRKRLEIESTTIDGETDEEVCYSMLMDHRTMAKVHAKDDADTVALRISTAVKEYFELAQ
jgi:hypothetical protein